VPAPRKGISSAIPEWFVIVPVDPGTRRAGLNETKSLPDRARKTCSKATFSEAWKDVVMHSTALKRRGWFLRPARELALRAGVLRSSSA
jgi:hypothetical protein